MKGMELTKVHKRFEVFNKAETKEAKMYLYGSIGSGWFADISSNEIRRKLNELDANVINVHINCPGGDVFESIAIHNLFKNHKAEIIIHIDGIAASGGSVIAMAGDKIIMPNNTMMMVHKAWTFAAGNADDLRKIADNLDQIDTAVTESYTSRFVGEREELEVLLADETYLNADKCLALGLCDEVVDEMKENEEDDDNHGKQQSAKEMILNKYLGNQIVASQVQSNVQEEPMEQQHNNLITGMMMNYLENGK
ncbi:Clp protease ClpP [Bacillus cereus]|nr:Clp protease ClpP [Bacillus cereus]MDA2572719.1 Clp protease ClpP [Bacillus cereus]